MNLKEIISSISESEKVPAGKVRKVAIALLDKMGEAIDSGERISFPGYALVPRTISAKDAEGDNPGSPERKVGLLRRRSAKQGHDDSGSME